MADTILSGAGIYAIVNKVNGKRYVGSSVNVRKRWATHLVKLSQGAHHSKKLQHAWLKYGAESFVVEVLESVADAAAIFQREQHWIDQCNSCESGYNILPTAGSWLGHKHSPETAALCSVLKKGKPFTEEHKRKLSAWQVGRKQSEETKARRSASLKGRPRGQDFIDAMTGRKNAPETIEKRRASLTGLKRSAEVVEKMRQVMLGRKLSPESIAKRTATYHANRLAKRST